MKDQTNVTHWTEWTNRGASFRRGALLNMQGAVATHFSLCVNDDCARFPINPAGRHFVRITASTAPAFDRPKVSNVPQPRGGG